MCHRFAGPRSSFGALSPRSDVSSPARVSRVSFGTYPRREHFSFTSFSSNKHAAERYLFYELHWCSRKNECGKRRRQPTKAQRYVFSPSSRRQKGSNGSQASCQLAIILKPTSRTRSLRKNATTYTNRATNASTNNLQGQWAAAGRNYPPGATRAMESLAAVVD